MKFAIILLVVLSVLSLNAYGQESVVMEQVISEVPIKVQLFWPAEVILDEIFEVQVAFLNPDTNELLEGETITFDIIVNTRDIDSTKDMRIETYQLVNTTSGTHHFAVMFPEEPSPLAEVEVHILSIGEELPINLDTITVFFTVKVLPEFRALIIPTIVLLLMAIAFIGIFAIVSRYQSHLFRVPN